MFINYLINKNAAHNLKSIKLNITKAENGVCIAELKVEKEHTNGMGGLHGGCIATIVDSLTSYALFTHKAAEGVLSVSVDIHVSYLKGAKCGDEILIKAEAIKCGKSVGFTECILTNKATGDIIAKGSHTKYLMSQSTK
ncbi:hypothetical protein RI129_001026 [Pyrocoelia pectoralis]|uniref:Thioesterase domain-containing protein n=1 Tax=Pyrocoelia pectoralis TaxID=417401 RepID=A0AAN7ZS48_9COLE